MRFEKYLTEVAGYTIKPKDKKIIMAFINGDKSGEGKALWIEGDYLYGPNQSTTSDYIAKRKNGKIALGKVYGNVSQTWNSFIKKNTPKMQLSESLNEDNIAQIIQQQLGGRALYMLGAKNLVAGKNYLSFRIGRNSKGVNFVKITLNGKDLYDVEFGSIRGVKYTVKKEVKDVYVGELHEIIERYTGMYTSL